MNPSSALHFIPFKETFSEDEMPSILNDPFDYVPNPLCLVAAKEVQAHLESDERLTCYFKKRKEEEGRGKMFGILVVRREDGIIGYLAAFSGKLDGSNNYEGFVPPIFDGTKEDGFLNQGMKVLQDLSVRIKELENEKDERNEGEKLKSERASYSQDLQERLFKSYKIKNNKGEEQDLLEIFSKQGLYPPTAAGECAAPKLLNYAFRHGLEPLAMAEFWWGATRLTDKEQLTQGAFYPACEDRCRPVLDYMLDVY